MGRERRILRGQMIVPAGGAANGVGIGSAPYELFELCAAIVAGIFKDGHNPSLPTSEAPVSGFRYHERNTIEVWIAETS